MNVIVGSLLIIYKIFVFILANLCGRYIRTKYVIGVLKRLKIDVRWAWESERLHFLTLRFPLKLKVFFLRLYYVCTPVSKGVAWGCAMESTFRIINILYFTRKYGLEKTSFIQNILIKESTYIENNLELHSNNNHILFNYIGLVLVLGALGDTDDNNYIKKLSEEIGKQFNTDGSNFEASTSYHALAVEAIAWLKYFSHAVFEIVTKEMNLQGALSFLKLIKHADGIFLVGDNDSSICIKTTLSNLKSNISNVRDIQYRNISKILGEIPNVNFSPIVFSDFGVFSIFDENYSLTMWNLNEGQSGKCGHSHNDFLSITLSVLGCPVILDPGTLFYALKRDEFRSSRLHSGISCVGAEPENFVGQFKMSSNSKRTLVVNEREAIATCTWKDFSLSRKIAVDDVMSSFKIEDCGLNTNKSMESNLILDPSVQVKYKELNVLELHIENVDKCVVVTFPEGVFISLNRMFISPNYGDIIRTTRVCIVTKESELPWLIKII
jgi:hypothetical protein